MPVRKSSTKRLRQKQQRDLKKLRDVGLISEKVDIRKKPSGYMRRRLRDFADVLTGKAKAVRTSKRTAKKFRGIYEGRGEFLAIPKAKGERVYYDRTDKKIKSVRTIKTKRGKRIYRKTIERDLSKLKPPKRGRARLYRLPLKRGKKTDYITSDRLADIENIIGQSKKLEESFGNWRNYIEVIDVQRIEDHDIVTEDDNIGDILNG